MAPHWFRRYVSSFSPQGFFLNCFSYPAVSHLYAVDVCCWCSLEHIKSFVPATDGARPKQTKINLTNHMPAV